MITPITTHVEDAKKRLLYQYKHSPNIAALIDALCQGLQDVEDAAVAMYGRMDIDGSEGEQLNGTGGVVGLPRGGWSDEVYTLALKARCGQLVSKGSLSEVVSIFELISQAGRVHAVEAYPAEVDLYSDTPVDETLARFVFELMQTVSGGGIDINYTAVFSPDNAFGFESVDDTIGGFGDVNDASAGGKIAYIQMTDAFIEPAGTAYVEAGGKYYVLPNGDYYILPE